MGYKHYSIRIALRIGLLVVLIGGAFHAIYALHNTLRGIYLLVFAFLAALELLVFLNRTHRDLTTLFTSILNNDFTTVFTVKGDRTKLADVYASLNQITAHFRELSTQNEIQFLYLQTVVAHLDIGILSLQPDGQIALVNEKMKRLLGTNRLADLDALAQSAPALATAIQHLEPGEQHVLKLELDRELHQLALQATHFKLENQAYKLVSVQDIKGPLEATELAAWQKLIRILTHEIMNSVTPITSLADTLLGLLDTPESSFQPTDKQRANIRKGLHAISERSKGLMTFTSAYRDLTRIPTPTFARFSATDLLDTVATLLAKDLAEAGIPLNVHVAISDLHLFADRQLMEQVVINLIQNAVDALQHSPQPLIRIDARPHGQNRVAIQVQDNGTGIPADQLEEIFVPFFSTKDEGSGIGLSLSRQIILKHKGSLTVQSHMGEGTVFTIIV